MRVTSSAETNPKIASIKAIVKKCITCEIFFSLNSVEKNLGEPVLVMILPRHQSQGPKVTFDGTVPKEELVGGSRIGSHGDTHGSEGTGITKCIRRPRSGYMQLMSKKRRQGAKYGKYKESCSAVKLS